MQMPYIIDANVAPLLFSECSSPQLVRARTAGRELMGGRTLFAVMPKAREPAYDDVDREIFDIIPSVGEGGGGYKDGQVGESDPTQSGNYTQTQQGYTQTGTGTQQQDWAARQQEEEDVEDGEDDDPDDLVGNLKKRGREESFNIKEDELLCDAWLATGLYSIDGTKQKVHNVWAKIHTWFHEHKHFTPYSDVVIHNRESKSL